jgi:hypothetical protein
MVSAIGRAIAGIPGLIAGVFRRALSALGGLASRAFSEARRIGSALWNGFKDGLGIKSPSFIEKAMFQITDTMGKETKKTANQVRVLQGLGRKIQNTNPVAPLGKLAVAQQRYGTVASAMRAGASTAPGAVLGKAQGSATVHKQVSRDTHITVNNPKPERASDSLTRTTEKMAYLGVGGGDD